MLERISAPLAAALSDDPSAASRFQALAREGLFLTPLDTRGEWFRYHSLFAELLRLRLRQTEPGEWAHGQLPLFDPRDPAAGCAPALQDARALGEVTA
mgnify:CR=1 FL=1